MNFFKKTLLISILSVIIIGCGGESSGGKDGESDKDNINQKEVKVNTTGLSIKPDSNYSIVTSDSITQYSSTKEIKIDVNKTNEPVILANKYSEPILYSLASNNDDSIEISLNTTAVVFTLKTPRFYGLELTNYKKMSKRIKNHKDFKKLVSKLQEYINNGSPCPTEHRCNINASNIAIQIANEIRISDITKKAQ